MTKTAQVLAPDAPWLSFQAQLERTLEATLALPDEAQVDVRWSRALAHLREYCLRPGKRVRPMLLAAGHALATGEQGHPPSLLQFGAGLELLHTFMLVHDDVADRATSRRGGKALHLLLAPGRAGEDLAVVLGDHLHALAIEVMLGSGFPAAREASRYMLGICRHTAAGQYLDLELARLPLAEVNLFQTLKVANLKTARYGFVAPLVAGAMLGGGGPALLEVLERVGRQVGLAFQLRDDLIGLFGEDQRVGKDGGGDFYEGKRTFPVVAAHSRADADGRAQLEALFHKPLKLPEDLGAAREAIDRYGGRLATQRVIDRMTRSAQRSLKPLPSGGGAREVLDALIGRLAQRQA